MSRIKNLAFDAALGSRIRQARTAANLSQGALGDRIGVSFQQVQKYELGWDQITVETLMLVAGVLDVAPESFLDGRLVALARPTADPTPTDAAPTEALPEAA